MPTIREYNRGENFVGQGSTRRASGADFGAAEAGALDQLGKGITALGSVLNRAKEANDTALFQRVKAEHTQGAKELEFELKNNPDFMENPNLYNEGVQKLKDDASERLADTPFTGQYTTDMLPVYGTGQIDVARNTVAKVNEVAVASADAYVDMNIGLASTEPNINKANGMLDEASKTYDQAVATGVMSQADALVRKNKAHKDFVSRRSDALIADNPANAMIMMDEGQDIYGTMTVEQIIGAKAQAIDLYRKEATAIDTAEQRIVRDTDRALQQNYDKSFRSMLTDFEAGELDMGKVIENQNNISPSDYNFFRTLVNKGPEWVVDPVTYSNLYLMADSGIDVTMDTRTALTDSKLGISEFNTIMRLMDSNGSGAGSKLPSAHRSAMKHIRTKSGADLPGLEFADRTLAANTLRDYHLWALNNPEASQSEAYAFADESIRAHALIDKDTLSITQPRPMFHVFGNPRKIAGPSGAVQSQKWLDIDRSGEALLRAEEAGVLDPDTFDRELDRLILWAQSQDYWNDALAIDNPKNEPIVTGEL